MDKKTQVNSMNNYIDTNPSILDHEDTFYQKLRELAPDLYDMIQRMPQEDADEYLENNGILLVTYQDYSYDNWLKDLRKAESEEDDDQIDYLMDAYPEYYTRHIIVCELNDGYDPVDD